MATHTELVNVPFEGGSYRFCLDRVVRDDEDDRVEYAFVWRGTSASADGFNPRPAYFDWGLLGQAIRQAFVSGMLDRNECNEFCEAIIGLTDI